MGLLSKRRGTGSTAEESTSPTVSPEKTKDSGARSRNARASFVENIAVNAPTKPAMRSQSSQGDLRRAGVAADGTPVAYDSTTAANHSRTGNFSLDEGAAALNGKIIAAEHKRRSTFSRGLTDEPHPSAAMASPSSAAMPSSRSDGPMPRSVSATLHQPVGEGSLSLAHLIPTNPAQDLRTPKPSTTALDPLGQSLSEVSMRVTGSAGQRVYAPVFEHSDFAASSSSSGTSSPAIGHSGDTLPPVIQLDRVPSAEAQLPGQQEMPPAAASHGLQPSAADNGSRARSASASSGKSGRGISPSRPAAMKRGSSKVTPGIAGALAMSGMALAASAPGVHSAVPVRQRTGSERLDSADTNVSGQSQPPLVSRSSEEHSGYESPTPLSNYSPHDSPIYDNDMAVRAMTSIDALGDFEDVVNQLGAGYALASSKRNAEFHAVFKHVPEDDFLIEDYGCALQREILVQGRLYISEHHLCFHANIFGWITNLVIAFSDIVTIEKRNTALVIPNAIHIATMHSRNTFASFLSRDMTYDLMVSLWRNQHPVVPTSAALPDTVLTDEEDEFGRITNDDEGQEAGRKKRKTRKGRFKKLKNGGGAMSPADEEDTALAGAAGATSLGIPAGGSAPRPSMSGSQLGRAPQAVHAPTTCNCVAGGGGHFPNVVMDLIFPGSPEKLYNLIFTSGFMRDFLCNDMGLSDLQIGDWAPQKSGSHLLTRTYSYIKPLSAPVGPKSAKCILVDENLHVDFDDFVTTLTTTRTPDVPSGGSFAVKTKTCCMWAKNNSTRVLVTTTVEWTGRSFIRSIVDRSSIDGQKTLYIALEKSVRAYIAQHKSEFYIGGEEPDGDAGEAGEAANGAAHDRDPSSSTVGATNGGEADTKNPSEPLAFISNNVPATKPLCDFLTTLWDTGADLVKQTSTVSLVLIGLLGLLVVLNAYQFSSRRKSSSRYVPPRSPPDYSSRYGYVSEQTEVAAAVRGVLKDYFDVQRPDGQARSAPIGQTPKEEVQEIRKLLETLENRIVKLKSSLAELD